MALPKQNSKRKYLTEEECMEEVKRFKAVYDIHMSDKELFNHHLEGVLGLSSIKLPINGKQVFVDIDDSDKETKLKEAFSENKNFVVTASSFIGDIDTFKKMYLLREKVEQSDDVDVVETYDEDGFNFKASVKFIKRT